MSHLRRRRLRGVVRYLALIALSALFVTPGAWLLLTSFKEDRDILITDWASLLPKVTQTRSVQDPAVPTYRAKYDGREVVVRSAEIAASPPSPPTPLPPKGEGRSGLPSPFRGRGVGGEGGFPFGGRGVGVRVGGRLSLFEIIEPKGLKSKIIEADPSTLQPAAMTVNMIHPVDDPSRKGVTLEDRPDGSVLARMDSGELKTFPPGAFERERQFGLRIQNYPDALDFLPEGADRGLVYLRNTLTLALMSVFGTLLSSSLAAYAFARLQFRGKNLLFTLLLSTLLLPAGVTLLPQFLIFRSLGWIDTLLPLWVPAFLGSAFNIFILRQFFASIPNELEDSARMDGCTPLRSYWSIMLPQVKPALIVIGVWTFIGAWNNFMGPLVYISSPENMPLSYALQLFHSEHSGEPTLEAAFALMMLLPVIGVFFAAQKQIMENAALSGLGGR